MPATQPSSNLHVHVGIFAALVLTIIAFLEFGGLPSGDANPFKAEELSTEAEPVVNERDREFEWLRKNDTDWRDYPSSVRTCIRGEFTSTTVLYSTARERCLLEYTTSGG